MMVVGIKLTDNGKTYFFNSNGFNLNVSNQVIVETEKGLQYGEVVSIIDEENKNNNLEYKNVIRIASSSDIKKHNSNLKDAARAINKCNKLIEQYGLDMKIIDASYTFDREQLIFRFVSDSRVDFRQLAKDLGATFKTRIELRQVGIRDKAKEVGGFGPCGRKLCCNNFLTEFDSVSINMAKNQNLSLNPTKINGVCGRLLCCLKYENGNYTEYKKGLPDVGNRVKTEKGEGKVISVDVFMRSYKVLLPDSEIFVVEVDNESKE